MQEQAATSFYVSKFWRLFWSWHINKTCLNFDLCHYLTMRTFWILVSRFAKLHMEKLAAQTQDWELNQTQNLHSVSSECNFFGTGVNSYSVLGSQISYNDLPRQVAHSRSQKRRQANRRAKLNQSTLWSWCEDLRFMSNHWKDMVVNTVRRSCHENFHKQLLNFFAFI